MERNLIMKNAFENYKADEKNPKWNNIIKRENGLYSRPNDLRSEFERDYTRIINSTAYRRLKHKTQVYFSPENDHICTRIEHVVHVESISYTIANYLGLNTELTKAIATAHDIGHSPFGHEGERILSQIALRDIGEKFWHEKNGLDFVDKVEVLEDNNKNFQNLNLTYAVRDGIISHCGEIDENGLKPREEAIDLKNYTRPNEYAPYTWEGCVVKVADKISYLGRDIEDAITMGILDDEKLEKLYLVLNPKGEGVINNTVIIKDLVYDLCTNSSPEKGLCFSDDIFNKINELKKFNYENIYLSEKLKPCIEYYKVVLNQIYDILKASYNNREELEKKYPVLINDFYEWYRIYSDENRENKYQNRIIFNNTEKDFSQSIIYYIAGMTDNYAIKVYESIIKFK